MKTHRLLVSAALVLACRAASAFFVPSDVHVTEYVNEITGHYVLLTAPSEVESGNAGPGWAATGHFFDVLDPQFFPGQFPVCRFYSPSNNSHFFTANAAECQSLKNPGSGWVYEEIAFHVPELGPVCRNSSDVPVYRLYNNRHAYHDANHRFTPDAATRAQMIAAGWVDEGVAWCALRGSAGPIKTYTVLQSTLGDPAQCESRPGSCLRVAQLPPMTNTIPSFLSPFFVNRNPDYPNGAGNITGTSDLQDVHTALAPGDAGAILSHSFVQADASTPMFGVHVNGADRTSGPYASIDPMYELPGAPPAPGATDERLFPWRGLRHHTLVAGFSIAVATVKRADPASHAYGNLMLQFGDAKSGHSFFVTVQAYGTVSPADFVAPDALSGLPIVSTTFRADPAFGTRIAGDFKACASGMPCIPLAQPYVFRMIDSDMLIAIERARTLDPSLSTDPADYFVGQFRVHHETYGNAEVGAATYQPSLNVYY